MTINQYFARQRVASSDQLTDPLSGPGEGRRLKSVGIMPDFAWVSMSWRVNVSARHPVFGVRLSRVGSGPARAPDRRVAPAFSRAGEVIPRESPFRNPGGASPERYALDPRYCLSRARFRSGPGARE